MLTTLVAVAGFVLSCLALALHWNAHRFNHGRPRIEVEGAVSPISGSTLYIRLTEVTVRSRGVHSHTVERITFESWGESVAPEPRRAPGFSDVSPSSAETWCFDPLELRSERKVLGRWERKKWRPVVRLVTGEVARGKRFSPSEHARMPYANEAI